MRLLAVIQDPAQVARYLAAVGEATGTKSASGSERLVLRFRGTNASTETQPD